MEHFNNDYAYAGFFATTGISLMHFEDILIALVLGFFGGAGGYLFKILRTYLEKRKEP